MTSIDPGAQRARANTLVEWNRGGSWLVAASTVGAVALLAALSKRSDAARMPSAMRKRVRDALHEAARQAAAARHIADPAHALVQCDRALATMDALEATAPGGAAALSSIANYDVVALREQLATLQRQAFEALDARRPRPPSS